MPGIQSFDKTRQRARELRQQTTPAEVVLWDRLRSRRLGGYKFRRQHPIGPYEPYLREDNRFISTAEQPEPTLQDLIRVLAEEGIEATEAMLGSKAQDEMIFINLPQGKRMYNTAL
jgi:very-short-patch-repair endonuclease